MRFQKLFVSLASTLKTWAGRKKSRGQSLVELALFLPVLLIIFSGLIELGFGFNQYINIVEATREGARFGVDGDPGNEPFKNDPARAARDLVDNGNGYLVSDTTCEDDPSTPENDATRDYYGQIACIVKRAAAPIILQDGNSNVIITVVRTYRDSLCDNPPPSPTPPLDSNGPECRTEILPTPYGLWPYAITATPGALNSSTSPGSPLPAEAGRWQTTSLEKSRFDTARIQAYLDETPIRSQSSAGILIVETFYVYEQLLKLPWITPYVPEEITFYTYTIVPLPAAEPRPTPTPTFTPSPTFTPTPIPDPAQRLNAGGPTLGSWEQSTTASGTTFYDMDWATTADTTPLTYGGGISLTTAPNAAPMGVYQTARTKAGGFTYTLSGLVPNDPYLLRLHFAENWNANRTFNVTVNGIPVWSNQKINDPTAAGAMAVAYIKDVNTTADGSGQISIVFTPGSGDPIINGIELSGEFPASECPNTGAANSANWALGQVTIQSSRPFGLPVNVSCRAVDGSNDGAFANGSVTRTNANSQAWWQVDLGQSRTIHEVRLWNTTDAANLARATDLYLVLSNNETFSLSAAFALQATGQAWVYHVAGEMNGGGYGPTRVWVGGQDWRYVRVILASGLEELHLAEVEVVGTPLGDCGGGSDPNNYALGKLANVSRKDLVRPSLDECLAVNGAAGGSVAGASVSSADGRGFGTGLNREQGFLQLDLGVAQDVGRVTLYPATDAPAESSNLVVLLSSVPFTSTNLSETLTQPGVVAVTALVPGVLSTSGTFFDPPALTSTRYIRVQRSDTTTGDYLSLAEVQVGAAPPPTNTPTPTLTPTPICVPNVVDATTSSIQIQNSPAWSDNSALLTIQVFLLDNCGTGITDNRPVTLVSSRPLSDTIVAPNPNTTPIGGYIYQFTVRSNTPGISAFTAQVGRDAGGTGPVVAITGTTNQGTYVCVSGAQTQSSNPRQLAIAYSNPSPPFDNRRLVQLQVSWQSISGAPISNSLTQISIGTSTNALWTGSSGTPANISLTSGVRNIASGASRNVLLDFAASVSPPAGSQWRYTIIASWDTGLVPSPICNSLPVVITLP